jgi:hypothetical protein
MPALWMTGSKVPKSLTWVATSRDDAGEVTDGDARVVREGGVCVAGPGVVACVERHRVALPGEQLGGHQAEAVGGTGDEDVSHEYFLRGSDPDQSLVRVADPIAGGDLEGCVEQREELFDDLRHVRVLGVFRDGFGRGPAFDDVEGVGLVRLLVEVVVEASGLGLRGAHELQQELLEPGAVGRLAAYLADDVALPT